LTPNFKRRIPKELIEYYKFEIATSIAHLKNNHKHMIEVRHEDLPHFDSYEAFSEFVSWIIEILPEGKNLHLNLRRYLIRKLVKFPVEY
jgi:hypothetical protein